MKKKEYVTKQELEEVLDRKFSEYDRGIKKYIEKVLIEQRKEFERYVVSIFEHFSEQLRAALELIPGLHKDVAILKKDVAELRSRKGWGPNGLNKGSKWAESR